ncbi:MAG: Fur family transcriptional regulator [Thermoplasmatota archaeon]
MDKYVGFLKNNNLKITHQRLEILQFLDTHSTHPTADEIYTELKKKNPALSKTTIYNVLETLQKNNLVQNLTISSQEQRYEIKNKMHHHFLCKTCKKIIDIEISCPNLKKILSQGHLVDEVHGYFKGYCKECLKNSKKVKK